VTKQPNLPVAQPQVLVPSQLSIASKEACEYEPVEEIREVFEEQIDTTRKPPPAFVGFTVGGNAEKKLVVSEEAQRRIDRIFADSGSELDDAQLHSKLDKMEKNDIKTKENDKEPKMKFGRPQIQKKEFHCPVKAQPTFQSIKEAKPFLSKKRKISEVLTEKQSMSGVKKTRPNAVFTIEDAFKFLKSEPEFIPKQEVNVRQLLKNEPNEKEGEFAPADLLACLQFEPRCPCYIIRGNKSSIVEPTCQICNGSLKIDHV
jgi:hypothetical protein